MTYPMLFQTSQRLICILMIVGLLLPNIAYASGPVMFDPGNNIGIRPGEALSGTLVAERTRVADPTNAIELEAFSLIPTKITYTDYLDAYNKASAQLDLGVHFRSQQLQRLDPATCVATPGDPDKCSFSVLKMQNNYLDFNGSRLYWRFCADYDEPFVGPDQKPQAEDDRGDLLKIDPFGYCPTWASLASDQQERRVASRTLYDETVRDPNLLAIDIRNQLIDAQRTFAFLALAEPATLTFTGLDRLKVLNNGTPQRRVIAGQDGNPDLVRDAGVFGLLQATRELANVHMIFGNEFMVDALRFPFSVTGGDTEQLVRDEQRKLQRALHQYNLAVDALLYALNYNLGGAHDTYTADFFTEQDIGTFAAASERAVLALTEIAKRDRLLGTDALAGNQAAIARLEESFLNQYLQGLALASLATSGVPDDPATPDINESRLRFLDNGGRDILNNLRRLVQQAQSIRAGLNPLGYNNSFVPLKSFEELLVLTCGRAVVCSEGGGLLRSAVAANADLRLSQEKFDGSFAQLKNDLTELKDKYETALTEICGPSSDADGDGLLDFATCGPPDLDGDGRFDYVGQNSGLMAQNYWEMVAAAKEVDLARKRLENKAEQILNEQERSGRVITVTTRSGTVISGNELAIGQANAFKRRNLLTFSESATAYYDASLSTSVASKTTFKGSANPVACILGGCNAELEAEIESKFSVSAGLRLELAVLAAQELVWDPAEEKIAQYRSATALIEALRDSLIEGANSAAFVKQLVLEQSELLIQLEIAQQALNKAIAEHNLLVDQYLLNLTQRQSTIAAIQESHLAKPYFRLFRDGAALEAARTLDQAVQAAYLTAKAWEYHTLTPVSYLHELYRVRNPSNLDAFLNKLAADYFALPAEQFSKRTYRLSLAQDIFGLTDQNLNPTGALSPVEVEQLRNQRFQEILHQNRYIDTSRGVNKIAILFSTALSHPKFLQGVFNNRIARITTSDPGCASGCRGLWLNLVTSQDEADFQGDLPQVRLTHGGHATYRNARGQEVAYNPAPAVMIGRSLPDGFVDTGTRAALMTTHVNLGVNEQPNSHYLEDRFHNLSIATSRWGIEIDLTSPAENTKIDLSKIRDIEVRMDTTYVTPNGLQHVVAASNAQLDTQELGLPTPPEAATVLAAYAQELAAGDRVQAAASPAVATGSTAATAGDLYAGAQFVTDPVNLGSADTGFRLEFHSDGTITGALCETCTPLFDQSTPVTGHYDANAKTFTFQTASFPRTIAGRLAQRTLTFQGEIKDNGATLDGVFTETITGYTAKPVVAKGEFLVTRADSAGVSDTMPLNGPPVALDDYFTMAQGGNRDLDVLANDSDPDNDPLTIVAVSSPARGVATTDGQTVFYTPSAGYEGVDSFSYTIDDGRGGTATALVTVRVNGSQLQQGPEKIADDTAVTRKDTPVTIDVLANDVAGPCQPLTILQVRPPANGTVTIDGSRLVYTPNPGFTGTDHFTYEAGSDHCAFKGSATVTVTITDGPAEGHESRDVFLPLVRNG